MSAAKGKKKNKRPRLVPPTLMQALTMPLHPYPVKEGERRYGMFEHPDMQELWYEVKVSTAFLVTVPAITYFVVKEYFAHHFAPFEAFAPGFACIFSIWVVIVCIIIIKYKADFIEVFEGRGHIPYDKSKIADVEYFRSEQYRK